MTVTNNYDTITYIANGTTTNFPWTYDYDATYGALVVKNETDDITYVEGEDYTIKNKTVIFNTAPANGKNIVLSRFTYRGQEVTFIEGEDFPAKDYETSLDRLFMIEQEQDKALADETAARIAADNDLQSAINNEAATRISKDNMLIMLIGNETDAREAADTAITNSIGNGTITLTQGGAVKGTFTTNQKENTTINLDASNSAKNIYLNNKTMTFNANSAHAYLDVSNYVEDGVAYFPTVFISSSDVSILPSATYKVANKYVYLTRNTDNDKLQKSVNVYVCLVPVDTNEPEVWGLSNGLSYTQYAFINKSNLVTTITSTSTDAQVPSAKCVYDAINK